MRWRTLPDALLRDTITPLFKSGDRSLASNYRGIALMCHLMKAFEIIPRARLRHHLMVSGAMPEEQGGFRAGRGTMDQLMILREVIEERLTVRLPTYIAFLDVAKAYDLTWRDAIWTKLRDDHGVKGQLWQMIREMYRSTKSCVAADGKRSKSFDIMIGVRQGSGISPDLFSVFINGLVKFIREQRSGHRMYAHGVTIGMHFITDAIGGRTTEKWRRHIDAMQEHDGRQLCMLLFADDIALIADSAESLRALIADVETYARQWLIKFNAKKCEIMIVGESKRKERKQHMPASTTAAESKSESDSDTDTDTDTTCTSPPRASSSPPPLRTPATEAVRDDSKFIIGGEEVRQSAVMRYLGVDMQSDGGWDVHMRRIIAKGRTRLPMLYRIDATASGIRTQLAKHLVEILVRPVLEYGAEVIAPHPTRLKEAERVMRHAACIITGAEQHTLTSALYGELGWRTMEQQYAIRKLNFFHRLRSKPSSQLAHWLFTRRMRFTRAHLHHSSITAKAKATAKESAMSNGKAKKRESSDGQRRTRTLSGLCYEVLVLMRKYGIAHEWRETSEHTKSTWRDVMVQVTNAMTDEWRASLTAATKGKLYSRIKSRDEDGVIAWAHGGEDYLYRGRGALRIGGQWKLRMRCYSVELNAIRHMEHRLPSPLCTVCTQHAVEDFTHFLLHCHAYDAIASRQQMITSAVALAAARHSSHERSIALERRRENTNIDRRPGHMGARTPVPWAAMSDDERVAMLLNARGAVEYYLQAFLAQAFALRKHAIVHCS